MTSHRNQTVLTFGVIGLTTALYLGATVSPAMHTGGQIDPGWEVLVLGWMGLFQGIFAWYANPFICIALGFVLVRRWGYALLCSVIALGLALTMFTVREMCADICTDVDGYAIGAYLWLASICVLFFGSLFGYFGARGSRESVSGVG